MVTATVDRVGVRALVPRTLGGPATERLRSAVGPPLAAAVPEAFAMLEQVDPGAYWVLRAVRVDVRVPASEPDPARSAARIASAMAAAVERVVRDGPSPDAVRFAGRTAYVAAYAGVRADGGSAGWVFDRLGSFDALTPADAVVAADRAVSGDLLGVVRELVALGRWTRLLDLTPATGLGRLEVAIGRLAAPRVGTSALAAVRTLRLAEPHAAPGVEPIGRAAHRRLRLLGEALASGVDGPEAVAAVWAVVPAPTADVSAALSPPAGADARVVPSARGPDATSAAEQRRDPEETMQTPTSERLSSLGAAAFLLAPDLDNLLPIAGPGVELAGTCRAAGHARALVLAAALGRDLAATDTAVRLAAGAEPLRRAADGEHDDGDLRLVLDTIAEWSAGLAEDSVFGWSHPGDDAWFAPLAAHHPELVVVARALVRRFAAHLAGFGRAGAAYLADRVLLLGGSVRLDEDAVVVELPRPPLHVLLALAGLDAFTFRCRWLDVPVVVVHEDA